MGEYAMIPYEKGPDGNMRPASPKILTEWEYDAYRAQVYPDCVPTYAEYLALREKAE